MEATIVVLLDYDTQTIQLFGECNKVVPFHDAFLLPILLDGKDVLYITSGDILSTDEIIHKVAECTIADDSNEPRYIHSTVDGYTKVTDIGITFAGPRDARPLDKLGKDVFGRSKKLRELLIAGKVDIITETQAKALRKPLPNKNMRDVSLNKILLDKPHQEALNDVEDIFADENEISSDGPEVLSEADELIRKGYGRRE